MKTNFVQAAKKVFGLGRNKNDQERTRSIQKLAATSMAAGTVLATVGVATMAAPLFLASTAGVAAAAIAGYKADGIAKVLGARKRNDLDSGLPSKNPLGFLKSVKTDFFQSAKKIFNLSRDQSGVDRTRSIQNIGVASMGAGAAMTLTGMATMNAPLFLAGGVGMIASTIATRKADEIAKIGEVRENNDLDNGFSSPARPKRDFNSSFDM